MKVFSHSGEVTEAVRAEGVVSGLVPTMGALHEGHASLVKRASEECGLVVVSVFVNPTQFNDPGDLKNYPRTMEADLALLESLGVDIVFAPSIEEMYPSEDKRVFDFGTLDKVLEGAHRPGHFNGVAQIVSKLFALAPCDKAYFGEKDFQQIAVIRAMARQLEMGIEIVPCPIVRAEDGLALSSRNVLLTPECRKAAPRIYAALSEAAAVKGEKSVEEVKRMVVDAVNAAPELEVEYFAVVNSDTFREVSSLEEPGEKRGCIAVKAGNVRLIDNIAL